MKKQLLLFVMMLLPMVASAHDIEVQNGDGVTIYYDYTHDGKELEISYRGTTKQEYSDEYTGNVVIPEEVTYMNITRKVTSIGSSAFERCSVTSVTIPNSVTSIGALAFCYCSSLEKVIVSDIAAWCGIRFGGIDSNPLFYAHHIYSDENTEIKDLVIPNSVTSIGDNAFSGCSGLTSVTIPNSVTSIGVYAFYQCHGLTSVTIPNSVTSIRESTFQDCSGLTSVTIGNSVKNISKRAFSNCSGLTSVTIGNSVTRIGERAFEYCSGLTSVTIGNSVTNIADRAFYKCSGLTSVTIGNSVSSIGYFAFDGCDIPTVISLIENPFSIDASTFSLNTFSNATLYVPKGTIEKYKATEGWKDFASIVESDASNGIAQIAARPVLVKTDRGFITVEGADDQTDVCVYTADGKLAGTAVAHNSVATVATGIQSGSIAIVKVGDKSVKVIMK